MTKKLFFQAIYKIVLGIVLVGVLIFLPAGTLDFKNGWLFMTLLFVPMIIAGFFMMLRTPELLKHRLNMKEEHKAQRCVVALSAVIFILGFVLAGLDFRFGWSSISDIAVTVASVVFILAYALYGEVIRENRYLSRTIKVQDGQKVVDTGLYSLVRHPMYFSSVLLFLSMPLILGSFVAFVVFLAYPFVITKRIKHEEIFLEKELEGYSEYKKRVKYKMIPFVW